MNKKSIIENILIYGVGIIFIILISFLSDYTESSYPTFVTAIEPYLWIILFGISISMVMGIYFYFKNDKNISPKNNNTVLYMGLFLTFLATFMMYAATYLTI